MRTSTCSAMVSNISVLLLASAPLVMASCSTHGVQGFSRDGAWASIVTEDGLFTISRNGAEVHFLAGNVNTNYPAVFAADGQSMVFVTELGEVLAVPVIGGNGNVITSEVASDNLGTLVTLASDMILFTDERGNGRRFLQVIDPVTTEIRWQLEGIGDVFVTHDALRRRAAIADQAWYTSLLSPTQLMVVLQMRDAPENLFLCTVGSIGLACDFERPLGRTLSKADLAIFESRVPDDPRSGMLTRDGYQLILRTRSWISIERRFAYSMWAVDLGTNLPPVQSQIESGVYAKPAPIDNLRVEQTKHFFQSIEGEMRSDDCKSFRHSMNS